MSSGLSLKRDAMSASAGVGLDWCGREGLHLGSPDRKKHRPNFQVPSFPQQSLYAPPQNTSSEHLIATNPFDDNPSTPPRNVHLAQLAQMVSSTTGGMYLNRNPAPPFVQNPTKLGVRRFNGLNSDLYNNSGRLPLYNRVLNHDVRVACYTFHHTQHWNNCLQQKSSWQGFNPVPGYVPPYCSHVNTLVQQTNRSNHPQPRHNTHLQTYNAEANIKGANLNSNLYSPVFNCIENEIDSHFKRQVKNMSDCDSSSEFINNGSVNKKLCQPFQTRGDEVKILRKSGQSANSFSDRDYLCVICKVKVADCQDALVCEVSCHRWFHRTCAGMTKAAYSLLAAEASAAWCCDYCMVTCTRKVLPALKRVGGFKITAL